MRMKSTLKELSFPREEYAARLKKVTDEMDVMGTDVLLCFDPPTHNYLTGYQSLEETYYRCLIVPRVGEPAMVTSDFERPGVELTSTLKDITDYVYWKGEHFDVTFKVLKRVCPRPARVGVEKSAFVLTGSRCEAILAGLRGWDIVDCSDMLQRVRWVKSAREIRCMERAGVITSLGMKAAMDSVHDGVTDNGIAAVAYRVMTENGGEYMCYAPFVTTGRRSGVPHSTYTGAIVKKGDAVFIELGACVERYSTPQMRSAYIGTAPQNAKKNAETLIDVLNTAIDSIKPGLTCQEVARSIRRKGHKLIGSNIISPGIVYGDYGYSTGVGFPPYWGEGGLLINPRNKETLEPGMVFHLNETMREVNQYGLTFSETVVVTKKGCRVLTNFERKFLEK